jgi:MoaA/NifB/PqqE/SkfB family radical SAM enzyme
MYNIPELVGNADFVEALAASLETGGPPPLLRDAKIKLTSLCNLRCVMCKYWQTEREDALDSDRWRDVFAELVTLGCRKVHFSGGEVFLRRDFLDLVESAVGLGLKVNVTTNGTLVDRERAKRLAASGVNSVSISLDGPTATSHDAVRGQAHAFRRSLRTIRRLRAHSERVRVRVNFVVMRRNFRRLPAMVRLAGELGAEELLPMPVDEKGPRRHRLSATQIREYNRTIAPAVLDARVRCGFSTAVPFVYPFGVTDEEVRLSATGLYARGYFTRRSCLAPWLHAFFAWNGDAYLCCMTNGRMDPLGNVGRQTVREVFHGPAYRKVRRRFLAGHHLASCHRCDLFLAENARLHAALDGVGDGAGPVLEAPGPPPALAQ